MGIRRLACKVTGTGTDFEHLVRLLEFRLLNLQTSINSFSHD